MTRLPLVIVSGTGFRTHASRMRSANVYNDAGVKVNIGAAVARLLAEAGYDLLLLARTEEKLRKLQADLCELYPRRDVRGLAVDILDEGQVREFVRGLDTSREYAYVHSAGLSTGAYHLQDDNPYLPIEEMPADLPVREFETVVKSLLLMTRALLPLLVRGKMSKIVVVNSMSGIRPYTLGYSHASAKAGLHAAVRSLSLELSGRGVLLSEVMPGIVDTGLYDAEPVKAAVRKIGLSFGRTYDEIPQMSPYAVAEAVLLCLRSAAHVLGITMVSQGQWPHQGA